MAKTRTQGLTPKVKKEEHEEKHKLQQKRLHGTISATKSKNKITKNRTLTQAQLTKMKSENDDDNKVLLARPKKIFINSNMMAKQITKLIGYIVNDKMSVMVAAKKVGIGYKRALGYYHEYKDDPEHKIPLPKTPRSKPLSILTQEKINNLIRYIVNDGMNVTQASKKANASRKTAAKYYAKYLEDPKRKIPLLVVQSDNSYRRYTQKEIADLIGYIVRDKMPLVEASKKVNMSYSTARRCYHKYLHNSNRDIPDLYEFEQLNGKRCTNDQVSSLIGYIVNDGMTLLEASIKAHVGEKAASKYYKQYLDDPENNIPTPENNNIRRSNNQLTVDQVKNFFCYIIVDKLNIPQASRKAKIAQSTGYEYYAKYVENPTQETNIKDMSYSADKMKRLVELVQNEKMSLGEAADTVNLNKKTAKKHYQQYLKDPQYEFPASQSRQYTKEDIKSLIDYIERDKMSIKIAARKIKMNVETARKYYKEYQNDREHNIPAPKIRGFKAKNETIEKYAQMISDIYKNNPSIKPIHSHCPSESNVLAQKMKEELAEEDSKRLLNPKN